MRRKHILERASVLNKASATSGSPFVLASKAPELNHVHVAGYECTACGTAFASQQGTEPFCINCGSEKVESKNVTVASLPETDKALSAVECKACGTHNVLADVTASALKGHMHCVTCGTNLTFETESLDRPITDAKAADVLDNVEQANSGPDDLAGGMTDDSPIGGADAAAIEQELSDASAASTPAAGTTETADQQTDDLGIDPLQEEVVVQALEDDELIEQQQMADQMQDQAQDGVSAYVQASLVALVLAQNKSPEFEIASTDDAIIAFADGLPVARLHKEKAGEHADVFHTASFKRSILQVASKDGVKAALAAYPFEAITVKFPQQAAVRAMVERKAIEASTQYREQAESHSAEFMQCMSLASTGLNKNFFRKHENALKAGFINTLTTAGVKGAAKIVEQVFAATADQYHKTLFTLAADLMKKSVDVRNQLAETLGEANAVIDGEEMPNPDNEDVAIDIASLSTRMENAAVRTARKSVVANVEVADNVASISEIRQKAGGRLF